MLQPSFTVAVLQGQVKVIDGQEVGDVRNFRVKEDNTVAVAENFTAVLFSVQLTADSNRPGPDTAFGDTFVIDIINEQIFFKIFMLITIAVEAFKIMLRCMHNTEMITDGDNIFKIDVFI